jgi:hypothetical protein
MEIDELIAEYEKDPVMKESLERARSDMAKLRDKLSPEKYREWLCSHFINVEDLTYNAELTGASGNAAKRPS